MKKLIHCLKWPVLFGIGQILIYFFFFILFRQEQILVFTKKYPQVGTSKIEEMVTLFLQTNKGSLAFSQFLEHYMWLLLLINLLLFIPFVLYFYQKHHVETHSLSIKQILKISLSSLFLALFLNLCFSFMDSSNRFIAGHISFLSLLSIGIVGPILEEYVFRGLFYENLKKCFTKKKAIIILILVFAIFHQGLIEFVYAFIMGIWFLCCLEKYGTIKASIIAHLSANFLIAIIIPIFISTTVLFKIGCLILCFICFLSILRIDYKKV